jgi:putative ABC transport system permease protein
VSSGEAVRVGSREVFSTVNGVNENVPYVFNRPLARGAYISRTDVGTRRRVAVLGAGAADKLFGDVDPLGRQVTVAGVRFR